MSKKPHPSQTSLFAHGSAAMKRTLPGLAPQRKRGSPGPSDLEEGARDHAIEQLNKWRSGLVEVGREIAIQLARQRGRITSVEVFAEMRAQGYDKALDAVDPRWMGAVFNEKDVWSREGWEQTGSHKRPVAIWSLRDPQNIPPSPRELVYRAISAAGERGCTVEDIVLQSALKGSRIRSALKELQLQDRIMVAHFIRKSRKTQRRQRVYVLPEHHPDIV